MDSGLFELYSDDEVMLMSTLIPGDRYVDVYICNMPPISSASAPLRQPTSLQWRMQDIDNGVSQI